MLHHLNLFSELISASQSLAKNKKANKPTAETSADDPAVDPATTVPPESEPTIPLENPAPTDHISMPENPVADDVPDPPSPARANSPQVNPTSPSPVHNTAPPTAPASPEVEVTGTAFVAPAEPTVLAKHTAKTEKLYKEKGK